MSARKRNDGDVVDGPADEPSPADTPEGGTPPVRSATPATGAIGLAAALRRATPAAAFPAVMAGAAPPGPLAGPRPTEPPELANVPRARVDDDFDALYGDADDEEAAPRAPAPRVPLRERLRARDAAVDLLLFRVGADLYATDLVAVEEALELGDVHPVPGAPPGVLGVLGLRGRLLTVYSPERALRQPPRASLADAYALVMRAPAGDGGATRPVAVVVDDVEDVHTADLSEVRDPGETGAPAAADAAGVGAPLAADAGDPSAAAAAGVEVVLGVLHWNGELVALVDSDALVAACAAGGEGAGHDAPGRETS